jgi:hypothetical protein
LDGRSCDNWQTWSLSVAWLIGGRPLRYRSSN